MISGFVAPDAAPDVASNGAEFMQTEVRKHSGKRWNVFDIAMFFTGRLAPFRFQFNANGCCVRVASVLPPCCLRVASVLPPTGSIGRLASEG